MLIYNTKQDLINKAGDIGSKSKTFRGSLRYMKEHRCHNSVFTKQCGVRAEWNSLSDWTDKKLNRRAMAYCIRLGLETHGDYENRMKSIAADRCKSLGLIPLDETLAEIKGQLKKKWPLRKSKSRWAGGNHDVSVSVSARPSAYGYSERAWSRNEKWSGTDSFASLFCTLGALKYFPSLRSDDGSIILDAEKIGHREYAITWVSQSKGFDLKLVDGFLVRGFHIKSKSKKNARTKVAKIRASAALQLMSARQQKKIRIKELRKHKRIWVGLDDSHRGGNCKSETKSYQQQLSRKFGGEIGGIRADALLVLRDDTFTRKAVHIAAARY